VADALQVELVAADHEVWSGEARLVVARTSEGDIGVMRGHEAILAVLAEGPVTIHESGGGTLRAAVHGGFLAVSDDRVSLLAEVAELADDIDVARARTARERAAGDDAEAAAARRRAEVRLTVAGGD
jgi:F-type H+-transporting ATPase subunit epsilon